MKITAFYSFNYGHETVKEGFPEELAEIEKIIAKVNAEECKIKESREKTMARRILYSPPCLNEEFKVQFNTLGWQNHKEYCEYIYGNYLENYVAPDRKNAAKPFRDMDYLKPGSRLGVEVQFGKYAFVVYNICAKMTIFHNLGLIDAGVEIIPVKHLADEMSSGIAYFEQIAWDLEKRGVANIDIPVLILGVDARFGIKAGRRPAIAAHPRILKAFIYFLK